VRTAGVVGLLLACCLGLASAEPGPAGLLGGIVERAAAAAKQHKSPAVMFDIDDTLLLTGSRTKAILLEMVAEKDSPYAALKAGVEKLDPFAMPHGVVDVARGLGVDDEAQLKRIREYWLKKFLTGDYLLSDLPLPGAIDFVRRLQAAGASVYYITSRAPQKMREGTEKALKQLGFPLDGKTSHLLMNDDPNLPGSEFKSKKTRQLAASGEVVACFENEPENLNVMHAAAPGATAVYLDTVHTKNAPPLAGSFPSIKDYTGP
jgi:hypothetical protein